MEIAEAVNYADLAKQVLEATQTEVTRELFKYAFREPTICVGCPDAVADRVDLPFDPHREEIIGWFETMKNLGIMKLDGLIYYKTPHLRHLQNHLDNFTDLQQLLLSLTDSMLEIHDRAMSRWMVTIDSTNPLPRVDPATIAAAEAKKKKPAAAPAAQTASGSGAASSGGLDEAKKAEIAAKVAAAKAAKEKRKQEKAQT